MKKINAKTIAAVLCALTVVLVFVSTTIFAHNMATITGAMPTHGHLNHVEITTGINTHASNVEIVAELSATVNEVLVQEGQVVTAGEPIVTLDFRGTDEEVHRRIQELNSNFNEQLQNIQLNRNRHQVDIERIRYNIANTQRQITELQNETTRTDTVSDFDLRQAQEELQNAIEDLERQQQLSQAGAIPKQTLWNAEARVTTAQNRLDNTQRTYTESTLRNQDNTNDQIENRERQIRNLEHQLNILNQDERARQLDIQALALQETTARNDRDRRIYEYNLRLTNFDNNATITASATGVITNLNLNQGGHINPNQTLATIGQNLVIEADIPLTNTFITIGSTAVMHNSLHTVLGTVTNISLHDHAKRLTLALTGDTAVTLGETFTIQFETLSTESFTLVPNRAINRDSNGYFINQIRRRDGILGTEFYTERITVYIGDSDSNNTAVLRGITFFQPVVVASSRPFSEGETINLGNEGDFFAN